MSKVRGKFRGKNCLPRMVRITATNASTFCSGVDSGAGIRRNRLSVRFCA